MPVDIVAFLEVVDVKERQRESDVRRGLFQQLVAAADEEVTVVCVRQGIPEHEPHDEGLRLFNHVVHILEGRALFCQSQRQPVDHFLLLQQQTVHLFVFLGHILRIAVELFPLAQDFLRDSLYGESLVKRISFQCQQEVFLFQDVVDNEAQGIDFLLGRYLVVLPAGELLRRPFRLLTHGRSSLPCRG